VIIRRQFISGLANDVGFVFKADGTCETLISDYDQGTFDRFWVRRLVQLAGVNAALKEAQRQGHRAVRRTHPQTGKPQVVVTGRW
jgi:hypothetical protein